jgi:hypothetical protein
MYKEENFWGVNVAWLPYSNATNIATCIEKPFSARTLHGSEESFQKL